MTELTEEQIKNSAPVLYADFYRAQKRGQELLDSIIKIEEKVLEHVSLLDSRATEDKLRDIWEIAYKQRKIGV